MGGYIGLEPQPPVSYSIADVDALVSALKSRGQLTGALKLAATSTASSTTCVFTADEVVVKSSLGGDAYCLGSFNQTINRTVTGPGGQVVTPASLGFTAIYALYNATSGAQSIISTDATSAVAPELIASLPTGYTHSALLAVVPTLTSTTFAGFVVMGRSVVLVPTLFRTIAITTNSVFNGGNFFPFNAKRLDGYVNGTCDTATLLTVRLAADTTNLGGGTMSDLATVPNNFAGAIGTRITTPHQVVINTTASAGNPVFTFYMTSYEI